MLSSGYTEEVEDQLESTRVSSERSLTHTSDVVIPSGDRDEDVTPFVQKTDLFEARSLDDGEWFAGSASLAAAGRRVVVVDRER